MEFAKGENNEGRGELPNDEGDVVKENYKAMHEENFWSSWLRGDERGK